MYVKTKNSGIVLDECGTVSDSGTTVLTFCVCSQRLKAEKAEITRFLQKSKTQQAPKVCRYTAHNRVLNKNAISFILITETTTLRLHDVWENVLHKTTAATNFP